MQFFFILGKDKKASIPGLPSGIPGVSVPSSGGNGSVIRKYGHKVTVL